jgi:hypothetical protein
VFPFSDEGTKTPTLLGPLESAGQWLRLARFKGSSKVDVSFPLPEDGNRTDFRNVVFSGYIQFRTMDNVQKPSDSECYFNTSNSEYVLAGLLLGIW